MTRQIHGFLYEKYIIKKYNLVKTKEYISKYDAFTRCFIPVQIKLRKEKSPICLGSFERQMSNKVDFILIIGTWKFTKCNIVDEEIYYIPKDKYNSILNYDKLDDLKKEMKSISNSKDDDYKWKKFCMKHKQNFKNKLVQINFKRDHKKQKRIQCSIPNKMYTNMFKNLFKKIIL